MAKTPVKDYAPWFPVLFTEEEAGALKALQYGRAEAHMQQLALRCIIEKVCDAYGLGWHPTGDHESSFAAGRRFAGTQIVKALNLDIKTLRRNVNG